MDYHPSSPGLTMEQWVVKEIKREIDQEGFLEEDPEINRGVKRKKNEKSIEEIAFVVEKVMAELEVVAEDDAQLNREGKPAIRKLQKLPFLRDVLSKKGFQLHFLEHGLLTLLKNWLEPLPDGSLPNATVREAVLSILSDFPLDLERHHRREQFKKSGLGRVIKFLSQSEEETTSNRRLAKELVDKWSRIIFNKSDRFSDLRKVDDVDFVPIMKRPVAASKPAREELTETDLDLDVAKKQKPSCQSSSSSKLRASRPEPALMDYKVRPQSKNHPEMIKAHARQQVVEDGCRGRIVKRLKQLKASNKKIRPLKLAC